MADMLGTGLSSLRALQRALDTTAHNIANVSTEGYTRQRVEFATRKPQAYGANWIGSGVDAVAVRRVYDQFLSQQARSSSGTLARLDAFAAQAERLDNLLGDTSNGLEPRCRASPTPSTKFPARRARFRRARCCSPRASALVERLKTYDTRLREMSRRRRHALAGEAREINVAGAGHRAPQRRHRRGHPADRPAAQRPARSARPAHRPALRQGRRHRGRRRRFHAQRVHRQRPAAGARHHGLADHHGQAIRSTRNALQLALQTPSRHRRHLAQRLRRHARRTARLAPRNARSGAQRARPHHAGRGHRRSTRSIARAWTSPARWAATSSTSAAVGRAPATTNTGTAAVTATRTERRRAHRATTTCYAHRHRLHAAAPGHGRRGGFHRHGHGGRSDSRRRPVHRRGRGRRDRRPVRRFIPTRDAIQGFGVAITDPARVAAAAPIRAAAASDQHRHRHASRQAKCSTPANAQPADHGEHRVHLGDHLLGQRRRRRQTYTAGRQHRRQRLARADQRRAGHGRHLHGAQQRRRRGRQPQCLRAGRCHARPASSTAARCRSPRPSSA